MICSYKNSLLLDFYYQHPQKQAASSFYPFPVCFGKLMKTEDDSVKERSKRLKQITVKYLDLFTFLHIPSHPPLSPFPSLS